MNIPTRLKVIAMVTLSFLLFLPTISSMSAEKSVEDPIIKKFKLPKGFVYLDDAYRRRNTIFGIPEAIILSVKQSTDIMRRLPF